MAAPIDFYFDFSSPYGYLAAQKIDALAAKHGRTVDWHPMLLGVVFKETGAAPLTMIPLKGDYSRRDFERSARFHGIAGFRMPPKFPIPSAGAGADRALAEGARSGARGARRARRSIARSSPTASTSRIPDAAAAVAGEAGRRRRGGARGDRRSGDQGCAEARSRAGDRARRVRLAVRRRRRRAVLGPRPLRPGRALARDRRVLDREDALMAEYMLHCFAQSGNAYKPALALRARRRRLGAALRRLFRRRDAHAGLSRDQRDGRSAGARASRRACCRSRASSSTISPKRSAGSAPADAAERREILRWLLCDNHKLTSYTATYRFMRDLRQGPRPGGAGGVPPARGDRVGRARSASRAAALRRRATG